MPRTRRAGRTPTTAPWERRADVGPFGQHCHSRRHRPRSGIGHPPTSRSGGLALGAFPCAPEKSEWRYRRNADAEGAHAHTETTVMSFASQRRRTSGSRAGQAPARSSARPATRWAVRAKMCRAGAPPSNAGCAAACATATGTASRCRSARRVVKAGCRTPINSHTHIQTTPRVRDTSCCCAGAVARRRLPPIAAAYPGHA